MLAALAAGLGGPGIESQPAFNNDGSALTEVLVYIFGLPSEGPAVHEAGFLPFIAVLSRPTPVDGQSKIDHRCLVGCI